LKCIYCCATSSTVWEKETGVVAKKINDEHYDNKLSPHLVHLKELFLSGGEPVLHPFNFKILRFLKSINPNLRLGMATNLTYNFDKHREFFDLYCSFPNSKIFCSIDIDGERFEAIRVNSKWNLIEKNLFELKKYNTKIYFNSVISVLNTPYFKNFHKEMIQKGIIDIDSIRYLTLSGPEALSIQNLPEEKKRNYLILPQIGPIPLFKESGWVRLFPQTAQTPR
jgi:MoaA/NifB/PqqE/SkfB family radical SAM enzyme